MIEFYPAPMSLEEQSSLIKVFQESQARHAAPVEMLEQAFTDWCQVKYAVAVASGTAALQVALMAYAVKDGDEVITPSFTAIATINAILSLGARPVFVDIDENTSHIRPDLIEGQITPKTKAILPVHLFGQMCEMDAIQSIAERHGLALIEDACQAFAAEYTGRLAGSIGTGVFSLAPESILNAVGGGVITTNDEEFASRCRIIRNQGLDAGGRLVLPGLDFRIKDHQAVIALEKLNTVHDSIERRRENAGFFSSYLKSVLVPVEAEGRWHIWNYFTVRVPAVLDRNTAVRQLQEAGIATDLLYWKPAHTFSHVREAVRELSLPVTERVADQVFSLPVHENLSNAELERIVTEVNQL